MKIENTSNQVQIVGGGSVSNFSIAANGKAFRVLSDTLYSDKIGSIVREIASNAYDAHVMANKKDVPFEVHIPDSFEPWFSVKDFGIGLSESEITNVFTVFFQSTKEDSNDAIGCFGLGSKTPFSYTDQFTITSCKDGNRTIYSAFIAENGMPSIIKMHSEDTTESNGVEIKVSVKRDDYYKFNDAVFKQLRFFKVKPIVLNTTNQFIEYAYSYKSENFTIIDRLNSSGNNYSLTTNIIQGNIGYPLNLNSIEGKINKESYEFLKAINGMFTELHFNIGEIGVTASREAVEYNSYTVANIEKKVLEIIKELNLFVAKELEGKTPWEQASFLNSTYLFGNIARSCGITVDGCTIQYNDYAFDLRTKLTDFIIFEKYSHMKKFKETRHYSTIFAPTNSKDFVFVVKDTSKQSTRRLNQLLDKYAIIQFVPKERTDFVAMQSELTELLGGAEVILLSSIEPPVADKKSYTRTKQPTVQYYEAPVLNKSSLKNWTKSYESVEDIQDECIYVVTSSMAFLKSDKNFLVYNTLPEKDKPTLIAVPGRNLEKAKANNNLTDLDEFVEQKINELKNNSELKIAVKRKKLLNTLYSMAPHLLVNPNNILYKELGKYAPKSKLTKTLRLYYKLKNSNFNSVETDFKIANTLSLSFDSKYPKINEEVFQKYFLMYNFIESKYSEDQIKDKVKEIAQYVAFVDSL